MFVMKADMDHFVPVAYLKKRNQHDRAYEWSNFRYCEGVINQRKSDHLVLDPFEVRDHWFEVLLPSMQLVLTDSVPRRLRKKAQFTLERLGLQNDEVVVRYRHEWFQMYRSGKLGLDGLRLVAPLLARAVEQSTEDWLYPQAGGPAG